MKISALKYRILSWVSGLTMLIFLLVPFHGFLTVWAADHFGHYTALRLWKEVLLVLAALGLLFLVATDYKIRSHTLTRRIVWLILAYAVVNLLCGLLALQDGDVTAKAFGYALIVNLRFLAFFLLCWALGMRMSRLRSHWQWLLLWPAAFVVLFGLLQIFVLPKDFLVHFGYGPHTIPLYETINNNENFRRIASTLRGPNPLGAYLLIPLSMLTILIMKNKQNYKQIALFVGGLIVLFFSYSRSAWIGAVLALATIMIIRYPAIFKRRDFWLVGAGAAAVLIIAFGVLYSNSHFQNLVFHTEDKSQVKTSSNNVRSDALQDGARDVVHDPLGNGPGSAGPASVYNDHKPRIAENYYLQIAQETGVIGLALFLLINAGVGYLLWLRREQTLALGLLASLIGLTFVNLLSHAWTDDAVAYVWWGMAGIAMLPTKDPDES